MGNTIGIKTANDRLLNLDYSDPEIIKRLLSNYGKLEMLARKGNTVASAVINDLQNALGVNFEDLIADKQKGLIFPDNTPLTEAQFVSIVFTLIYGYQQSEVAFILDCSVPTVNVHITRGLKRICEFLEDGYEKNKEKDGRSGGSVVAGT